MTSLLNDVNILISKRVGDLSRLEHIKETIENNKQLYDSDRKYIDDLTEKHLFSKEIPDDTPKVEEKPTIKEESPKKEEPKVSPTEIPNKTTSQGSFCGNCGASKAKEQDFCTKCGQQNYSNPQKSTRSKFWYLLPIFFGIIGGLIAYLVLRESDSKKARNCLIIGLVILLISIFALIGSSSNDSSIGGGNEDWLEDYYLEHPEEDLCNPAHPDYAMTMGFGLCR
jgi:hypothetical protein